MGIARGIADQDNRDGPELLSPVNPTFTWVRLAQRVPVRIHLMHVPPSVLISAGMTCTVVMKERAAPEIGLGIKKAIATILERLRVRTTVMAMARRRPLPVAHGYAIAADIDQA